jgi:sugar (pentulose or hexulose) kinase
MARHADRPRTRLVGAGNGLRENAVLAGIVAETFGLPLAVPRHREEAAYGAALVAAVGAELFPDVAAAGRAVCIMG